MCPSEAIGSCSRSRVRSCSRASGDIPAITLPCGPTGTVFESQKSSKVANLTGMRMTRVSIASSPAISQKLSMASNRDASGLGRNGTVESNYSIAVYTGVVGAPPFRMSHM